MALKAIIKQAEINLFARFSQEFAGNKKLNAMKEEESILKRVDTRYDGRQAVDAIKDAFTQGKHQYALILMDCNMPVLDGYEASNQIKNHQKNRSGLNPYIVACTGHVEPEFITKAWANQMDEVIAKPMSVERIEGLLQEMVEFDFKTNS